MYLDSLDMNVTLVFRSDNEAYLPRFNFYHDWKINNFSAQSWHILVNKSQIEELMDTCVQKVEKHTKMTFLREKIRKSAGR